MLYILSSINSTFINTNISDNNTLIAGVNSFNISSLVGLVKDDFKSISYLFKLIIGI